MGRSAVCRHDIHIDGKNVGFIVVKTGKNINWLENLEVREDYRGQGLSKILMGLAVRKYGDQPIETLSRPHSTSPLNADQLNAFYGSYGFVKIRKQKGGTLMRRDASPPAH